MTFKSEDYCKKVWSYLKKNESELPFSLFVCEPIFLQEMRIVNVHLYNPYVPAEDVSTFLGQFCNVIRPPTKSLDEFGMWTGTWKVWVRFRPCKEGYEGVRHPPSSFSIGTNRGYLFYMGQPEVCRKCSRMGHKAETCEEILCRNCSGTGHYTKECTEKRKCNLCGSSAHLFFKCPHRAASYAGAAEESSSEESDDMEESEKESGGERQSGASGDGSGGSKDDGGAAGWNGVGVDRDDGGVRKEGAGVSKDDGGVRGEGAGVSEDDGGARNKHAGVNRDDGGVDKSGSSLKGGGVKVGGSAGKSGGGMHQGDGGADKVQESEAMEATQSEGQKKRKDRAGIREEESASAGPAGSSWADRVESDEEKKKKRGVLETESTRVEEESSSWTMSVEEEEEYLMRMFCAKEFAELLAWKERMRKGRFSEEEWRRYEEEKQRILLCARWKAEKALKKVKKR
ncbi:zinc finger CCHC domain-containing protein 3-like [Acipenser oxyrinchus oxyrinchus]|uniref:Zinc finger CCHC domain-containing protein 3-like n=1 Tax=Acipenser oxyrinchus oxyrinchus TaxID=40147 RepID=A0AAD8G079_ACIOX|nr:zinc finger CCHC domain-containing protein 3-like [Acipenser oxyrinchus oxyrinchus]